jgi:hypothetical protein
MLKRIIANTVMWVLPLSSLWLIISKPTWRVYIGLSLAISIWIILWLNDRYNQPVW